MDAKNENSWINRRLFWNVRGWHLLSFVGMYVLFGIIYWLALLINAAFEWNAWEQTIVSYATKAVLSLPVYWLIFIKLEDWSLQSRLSLHLATMPIYVVACLFVFRAICDFFGLGYLRGTGTVWDIYIPFLLYSVQFGFLHFYEYFHRSEKLQQAEHEMRQLALQSEVNALKAQIQPHFLFNTLNSISASVPPQMERTRELIANLADTFRFGLRASQSERIPLRDEIDFLQTYLRLEKQRFGKRLNVEFRVGEELLGHPVPPMLLQPLVENAIKHGVGPSMEPVLISVSAERVGEGLRFSVSDTGPGKMRDYAKIFNGDGIGIRNTQLRLEKVFGEKLKVRGNEPNGLIFEFELPIEQVK